MKASFYLFSIFLIPFSLIAQNTPRITMSDFMGVNSNVAAYDNNFLGDLSKCVKWIREYHDWSQYEAANNYYKWDNITSQPQGYTWPEHTDYMKACRALGMNVLIDVLGKPDWAGTSPIPLNTGSGSNASDYIEKLEFIGQLVARYGSKKIATSLLETADKATGLNLIKYYEDDNEPDYTWKSPLWPAVNYAKYCNAVHDGFGVTPDADHPLLGIKSVDPDAIHVMAGLASADTIYINTVLKSSNGRVPFDVLNVHCYCTDFSKAYSPENERYGYEASLRKFFKWRTRNLPDIPIWMTEFGWDTYLGANSTHSYTYAPALQQANYLLRSYLVLLKLGFGKAFLFMDTDTDSKNILQYSSSGLLADKNSKYTRKTSFYYLATLQNVLGKAEFSKVVSYKETSGANEVYCYEFVNPGTSENIYALWTRKSNSNTDDGTKISYQFNPGYQTAYAYSILPTDHDLDGDTINYTVTDQTFDITLSETPQFLVVSGIITQSILQRSEKPELKVFPNPAKSDVQISFAVAERQSVNLSVYTARGILIKTIVNSEIEGGTHTCFFGGGLPSGAYFVKLNCNSGSIVQKFVLMN